MSACSSCGWLSISASSTERQMVLPATHLAVYLLVAFHWAPLLRLFQFTLKWIKSEFESIIRENMDLTNEITDSWQSILLKLERKRLNFIWFSLSGFKLLVATCYSTKTSDFTFFCLLHFFFYTNFSLSYVTYFIMSSFRWKKKKNPESVVVKQQNNTF